MQATRVVIRKDTLANWTNANPPLADGELVFATLTNGTVAAKLGNTSGDVFNSLPFLFSSNRVDTWSAGSWAAGDIAINGQLIFKAKVNIANSQVAPTTSNAFWTLVYSAAAIDHNHDDRYYTIIQIDQKFASLTQGGGYQFTLREFMGAALTNKREYILDRVGTGYELRVSGIHQNRSNYTVDQPTGKLTLKEDVGDWNILEIKIDNPVVPGTSAATLTSITLSGNSTVNEGASLILTAIGLYSDNTTVNLTNSANWTLSEGSIGANGVLSIPTNSVYGDTRNISVLVNFNGITSHTKIITVVDTTSAPNTQDNNYADDYFAEDYTD